MNGAPEPIDPTVDVASLKYDLLVDGNLPADDAAHHRFKTLQAAYAAAPEGKDGAPTVIGIKPNVYALPRPGGRTPSLLVEKNNLTFLGLTNDRRTVVLADNCGLMQGADDDGYILDVRANGFTARNLTIVNYCNNDYEYPGDPSKNLHQRSKVITQAVALQAQGDKHVYENVALLSRLDTMFLRTTRSYFKNVYIEGTDDWMGGGQVSVWQDCTLVYPTGRGVFSASNVIFLHCTFQAARGFAFYKAEFRGAERPDVLIDCTLPDAPVSWIRGKAPPRPQVYSLTYRNRTAAGQPVKISDCTVGSPAYTYSREMTGDEVKAFNPYNLLRERTRSAGGPDEWDPARARAAGAAADGVVRMAVTVGQDRLRTGQAGVRLGATPFPRRGDQTIRWVPRSSLVDLSATKGASIIVRGNNQTDEAAWVPIDAIAADGVLATAYVYVEPRFTDPPLFSSQPRLLPPAHGVVHLQYTLDLGHHEDQSNVIWTEDDPAKPGQVRQVAISRDQKPALDYTLTTGDIGQRLHVTIQPKHNVSEPGPAVTADLPEVITAADVPSRDVSPDFRSFVTTPNRDFVSGRWTVIGAWKVDGVEEATRPSLPRYGIKPNGPSYLYYQQDAPTGDMTVELEMTPEKTEGTGFSIPGSPADTVELGGRNLHSDVYIKFDPRTRTGYLLRFWRTTQSAAACRFQLYHMEKGVGTPIDSLSQLTGVLKPTTHLTLKVSGDHFTAMAANTSDGQTLALSATIVPNSFGGAGIFWPRGSSTFYRLVRITYP